MEHGAKYVQYSARDLVANPVPAPVLLWELVHMYVFVFCCVYLA